VSGRFVSTSIEKKMKLKKKKNRFRWPLVKTLADTKKYCFGCKHLIQACQFSGHQSWKIRYQICFINFYKFGHTFGQSKTFKHDLKFYE